MELQFPLCGAGKAAALAAPASCSMSPTAAEHLKDEVKRALHLLHDLTEHNPPAEPLGKLQPALVKHCKVRHGCWCTEGTVEKAFGRQLDTLLLPSMRLNQQGQQKAWTLPFEGCLSCVWVALLGFRSHPHPISRRAQLACPSYDRLDNLCFCMGEGPQLAERANLCSCRASSFTTLRRWAWSWA